MHLYNSKIEYVSINKDQLFTIYTRRKINYTFQGSDMILFLSNKYKDIDAESTISNIKILLIELFSLLSSLCIWLIELAR